MQVLPVVLPAKMPLTAAATTAVPEEASLVIVALVEQVLALVARPIVFLVEVFRPAVVCGAAPVVAVEDAAAAAALVHDPQFETQGCLWR